MRETTVRFAVHKGSSNFSEHFSEITNNGRAMPAPVSDTGTKMPI